MLFTSYNLKGKTIKNRIVFPPVVCTQWSFDSKVSEEHIEHYQSIAKGGVGLVIIEASCITPTAKLNTTQLGIWSDEFIEGFSQIARVCHEQSVPVMAQIHHGGMQSVSGQPVIPTEIKNSDGTIKARELTINEIKEIENQFVDAAIRIKKAGLDGIELHGAHGYLLSYFHSSNTNKRQDEYGGSVENRARLSVDIIKRIRNECGNDFIIGMRFGGASPTLEDGIKLAKLFEAVGCDILHVSFGASPKDVVTVPQEFSQFNSFIYTAIEIKKNVSIPVIAVNGISTLERAKILVDGGHVDFAAIAKDILADYDWANKVKNSNELSKCFQCKPMCQWFKGAKIYCPAKKQ